MEPRTTPGRWSPLRCGSAFAPTSGSTSAPISAEASSLSRLCAFSRQLRSPSVRTAGGGEAAGATTAGAAAAGATATGDAAAGDATAGAAFKPPSAPAAALPRCRVRTLLGGVLAAVAEAGLVAAGREPRRAVGALGALGASRAAMGDLAGALRCAAPLRGDGGAAVVWVIAPHEASGGRGTPRSGRSPVPSPLPFASASCAPCASCASSGASAASAGCSLPSSRASRAAPLARSAALRASRPARTAAACISRSWLAAASAAALAASAAAAFASAAAAAAASSAASAASAAASAASAPEPPVTWI